MNAKDIVMGFEKALGEKDYAAARALLADDLSFQGPIDTFHDADAYITALKRLGAMVDRVEVLMVLAEGHDVAVFCNLAMKPPAPASVFVGEWHHVEQGRIKTVRVVFDARPFGPPAHK
jgi:hypothetical protein